MIMSKHKSGIITSRTLFNKRLFLALLPAFFVSAFVAVDLKAGDEKDAQLLDEFIRSKGYPLSIVFDASNIKQFWIDNSVSAKGNTINILTPGGKSVPLKFQLVNVKESQDCKVEVITESPDMAFSVQDSKAKKISSASVQNDDFLDYHVVSSVFHLEDASDFRFNLVFESGFSTDVLKIKKIVLSFSRNKDSFFLDSPGSLKITKDNVTLRRAAVEGAGNGAFAVTGTQSVVLSKNNIFVTDNTLNTSITVKNTGTTDTKVMLGFAVYDKDHVWLNFQHYPYNNVNKVLTVISAEKDSSKIIVDSYPDEWRKNCFIALNAKEDLSDVPNRNSISSKVADVKKLENGQCEIILDKPLDKTIEKGTAIRFNASGAGYLTTETKVLKPGEEAVLTTTIQKDNAFFEYSPKAFSRGVYYVTPLLMSYSVDSTKENTIQVSDFTVSY